jgi:hypothetical protein
VGLEFLLLFYHEKSKNKTKSPSGLFANIISLTYAKAIAFFRNPRFLTFAALTVFLHGETDVSPTPFFAMVKTKQKSPERGFYCYRFDHCFLFLAA